MRSARSASSTSAWRRPRRSRRATRPARRRPSSSAGPRVVRSARLPVHGVDVQDAGLAVEERVDAADQLVPVEEREDEVAVLALRLGDVDLEPEAEAEQLLGAVAVVDELVERRQQRRPRLARSALQQLGVGQPVAAQALDLDAGRTGLRGPAPSRRAPGRAVSSRRLSRTRSCARRRASGAAGPARGGRSRRPAGGAGRWGRRARRCPRAARCRRDRRRRSGLRLQRISSIRPRFLPSFQPPVFQGSWARSSSSRERRGPRRRSSRRM